MTATPSGAESFVPDSTSLRSLATAARDCRGCGLYRDAEQTVFGEGRGDAPMMIVGEQPGDQEDRTGRPFVGPAGRLLSKALNAAGVNRDLLYVTNAVKHFKFTRTDGSSRRIHKSPSGTEVVACRPWLIGEIVAVCPDVLVLLGATAAESLLGSGFRISAHPGEVLRLPPDLAYGANPSVVVGAHPSSVLRAPDPSERFDDLVAELRFAADLLRDKRR